MMLDKFAYISWIVLILLMQKSLNLFVSILILFHLTCVLASCASGSIFYSSKVVSQYERQLNSKGERASYKKLIAHTFIKLVDFTSFSVHCSMRVVGGLYLLDTICHRLKDRLKIELHPSLLICVLRAIEWGYISTMEALYVEILDVKWMYYLLVVPYDLPFVLLEACLEIPCSNTTCWDRGGLGGEYT